jgi:hypothetical protein
MKICLGPVMVGLLLFLPALVAAQADDEDTQSWNDVQLTVPVHSKVDIVLQGTVRFGNDLSRAIEGRAGAGLAWKVHPNFSVSPGYLYIETRNSAGQLRTEHRYVLSSRYRFPIRAFGLSHRSQYEYRVRSAGNSWRYRPSITFEKELPENFIPKAKLFLTEEVFYVSTADRFSRNRFSIGINKTITPKLSLDIYYLRQNDGTSHPGDLNVIGTSWKVKL